MRGRLVLCATIVLVLAACGSDDADGVPDPPPQTEGTDEVGTTLGGDSTDGDRDGAAMATVTLGDETYEFALSGRGQVEGASLSGRCSAVIGILSGSGYSTDGRYITIDFEFPPEDWETNDPDDLYDPPEIEVDLSNEGGGEWSANANSSVNDDAAGSSQVDSFTNDGSSASGTATFYSRLGNTDEDVLTGTFDIDCP